MILLEKKSLYTTLLALILFFVLPIILYNGYYVDDNIRAITGKPDWSWVGRTFADWIMISLSLNKYIDDFSPVPLILGLSIFSYVLYYAIKNTVDKPNIIHIFPFLLLLVNPFFMQNLTYKFDSLPMLLALSCSVMAYYLKIDSISKRMVLQTTLLFFALELYQPCVNVFLILSACNILFDIKNDKSNLEVKTFFLALLVYIMATIIYMLVEKIINPNVILSRGHIVPITDFSIAIKNNVIEFFKITSFLIGKTGIVLFSLPILVYWLIQSKAVLKEKISYVIKFLIIVSPILIFFSIWGPLILLQERISLPRELPTVGVLLFLNGLILLKIKLKFINLIPIMLYLSSVLFCGLFINILKLQDNFNDMIYSSIYNNITTNPDLYNVKEIKINGNVPINRIFSNNVKKNPYFYTLTMATPEWLSRAILIRKGLPQIKISFDGNDKKILHDIVDNQIKSSINNQYYIIYKYNDITYLWFK